MKVFLSEGQEEDFLPRLLAPSERLTRRGEADENCAAPVNERDEFGCSADLQVCPAPRQAGLKACATSGEDPELKRIPL
jgi:hypothetical protein